MTNFKTEDAEKPKFTLSRIMIDGNESLVSTFQESDPPIEAEDLHYASGLFVPKAKGFRGSAWMWVYSKNPEGQITARNIFESIKFGKK